MNIQLQLEKASLNITEGNEKHIEMAIEGFFGVCRYSLQQPVEKVLHQATEKVKRVMEVVEEIPTKILEKEEINSRSRQLPLIGSAKSLTQKPFDNLAENLPQSPQSGVRETENGLKLYKSHYMCPACGNEGTRYNRESNWYMKCHDCDTKIAQEAATFELDINDIPVPDKDGNFFVGRYFYLEEDSFKEAD
ncbi:hypothetical protein [Rummeliibacillus sp. TYF-LIM-RU47]|uniref:hypothetical protein n=1 Tax=Rummeliibacillus sp. TYF-LIM-RU47 TaxID=2608406 RepID=UPI00123AE3ED|nr:hypothetical protein [Rummeliibacillus sp. TYF-LIM-RU47]